MEDYKLYINGEFVEGTAEHISRSRIRLRRKFSPRVPDGNEVDVDKAVAAARARSLPGVRSRLKKELITWRNSPTI